VRVFWEGTFWGNRDPRAEWEWYNEKGDHETEALQDRSEDDKSKDWYSDEADRKVKAEQGDIKDDKSKAWYSDEARHEATQDGIEVGKSWGWNDGEAARAMQVEQEHGEGGESWRPEAKAQQDPMNGWVWSGGEGPAGGGNDKGSEGAPAWSGHRPSDDAQEAAAAAPTKASESWASWGVDEVGGPPDKFRLFFAASG
jgi:hypothetical protein